MKFETLLENLEGLADFYYSRKGYPVFDIMIVKDNHYASASNMVFYKENELIIQEIRKMEDINLKNFLKENKEHIFEIENLNEKISLYSLRESNSYINFVKYFDDNMKRSAIIVYPHFFKEDKLFVYDNITNEKYKSSINNLDGRYMESLELGRLKNIQNEPILVIIEGDGLNKFLEKNPIAKELHLKSTSVYKLTKEQLGAKDMFFNLVDSLFNSVGKKVDISMNLSEHLDMNLKNASMEYKILCNPNGKCSLGVINHTNQNSTLSCYDSFSKVAVEIIQSVHKTQECEIIKKINPLNDEAMDNFAWHVTPTKNIESILKNGLKPNVPEEDGDLAISLFKTEQDAIRETNNWLSKKFNDAPLSIIKVDISSLILTETSPYEWITTNNDYILQEKFISIKDFTLCNSLKLTSSLP